MMDGMTTAFARDDRRQDRARMAGTFYVGLALTALITLFARPISAAERLLFVSWEATSPPTANAPAAIESVLWGLISKTGNVIPAAFSPVADPNKAPAAREAVESAWNFVLQDATGRRSPESLEHASRAWFAVKDCLGELQLTTVARAALALGVATYRGGNEDLANEYFRAALLANPDLQKTVAFGSEIERALANAGAALDISPEVESALKFDPPSATLLLDGRPLPSGAATLRGRAGMHVFQAVAPGYFPFGHIVELGGASKTITLAMKSHPSRTRWEAAILALKSAPAGAAGLTEPKGWDDLLRLSEASRLLAIRVTASESSLQLDGAVGAAGGWSPFSVAVTKDATIVGSLTSLLNQILPPLPPPPAAEKTQ